MALFSYMVLSLASVIGLIFTNNLTISSIKHQYKKQISYLPIPRELFNNIIWGILLCIDLIILSYAPSDPTADMQKLHDVLRDNAFLKLILLYYASYMLSVKIIPILCTIFAGSTLIAGITIGAFTSFNDVALSLSGCILFTLCAWRTYTHREEWLDARLAYILATIVFATAWMMIILPFAYINHAQIASTWLKFIIVMLVIHYINRLARAREATTNKTLQEVYVDSLTKIHNRNYFDKKILEAYDVHRNRELPLTFAIFDIDHFKRFNDTYGHVFGDQLLYDIAQIAEKTLVNTESQAQLFRIGGEEFGVLFRNQTADEATYLMETVCRAVSSYTMVYQKHPIHATISVGITQLTQSDTTLKDLYQRSDKYLYQSKKAGRRRITSEGKTIRY